MKIYVQQIILSVFSHFHPVFNDDVFTYIDFTCIAASTTASDDIDTE